MKNVIAAVFTCLAMHTLVFSEAKLIITSKLDDKNNPVDRLTEIPFIKDRQYLMYVYSVNGDAFHADKIFFEISVYDEQEGRYKYANTYTVDAEDNWSYCYQGVFFNSPQKLRIRVFSDVAEMATKYIDVVK